MIGSPFLKTFLATVALKEFSLVSAVVCISPGIDLTRVVRDEERANMPAHGHRKLALGSLGYWMEKPEHIEGSTCLLYTIK